MKRGTLGVGLILVVVFGNVFEVEPVIPLGFLDVRKEVLFLLVWLRLRLGFWIWSVRFY